MRLVFHYRPQPSRKQVKLLPAVIDGAATCGIQVDGVEGFTEVLDGYDGAIMFGIGGIAKPIYDAYRGAGRKLVFFDKGYTRKCAHGIEHFRVAVNGFQPLEYLDRSHPPDRFLRLGLTVEPYRSGGSHVLFDGASNKYCRWQGLGYWLNWGMQTLAQIRAHTDDPIIYRPRPAHNVALTETDIQTALTPWLARGVEFSQAPLADDLARARVVVSYGGNIGWDAALLGIPHFAMGDSIARPISETTWVHLDRLRVPTEAERLQWAANVAYQQWTMDEIASGAAWRHIVSVL